MTSRITMVVALAALLAGCAGSRPVPLVEQQRRISDLNERALASSERGATADAHVLLQQALKLAESLDDHEGQVTTMLNKSRLLRHAGSRAEASAVTDRALHTARQTPLYSDAAQEKALIELAAGRMDEAERWARIAHKTEQGSQIGRRLNLLARLALLRDDPTEATVLAEQALAANRIAGQELERANSLRILGTVKTLEGAHEKAEELLLAALELDRQQAAPAKIAADLEALADLARTRNQEPLHQDYLQRARAVRNLLVH